MCRIWNPNPRTVAENLALLEERVASPLDRAMLDALTERAEDEGLIPRPTVERMTVDATGKGLALVDVYQCDWCDTPATRVVRDTDGLGGMDFACSYHLGYWFHEELTAGTVRTVPVPPARRR